MRWFGLLTLAFLVGCTNSMDSTPSSDSGTVTTNKPVLSDPGSVPEINRPTDEATNRDNTAVNTHDQDSSTKTPFDQGQDSADVSVTADIRMAIVNKSDFSVNARNVKIITEDGRVTLRGPVDSQAEKDAIDGIAKNRVSPDKVDNQLEVVPPKSE